MSSIDGRLQTGEHGTYWAGGQDLEADAEVVCMDTHGIKGGAPHAATSSENPAAPTNTLPMKVFTTTMTIDTQEKEEIRNLTDDLASLPALRQIAYGFVLIHSLHTTAGLCLNEFQDALLQDLKAFLHRLIPSGHPYRHNDPVYSDDTRENATSHLCAVLLGQTLQVPIEQGRLKLGTWQRVLFCEFDGPQTRHVYVQGMGV
jgi:secondary thiamine-phosphate synthase enzyme